MRYQPINRGTSHFVTLGTAVWNYYQQNQDSEDSDGYESDSDDGPYWRVALQTNKGKGVYPEEEYEYEDEDEYYAEPAYEAYPVQRTSTRIANARERASQMPGRVPPPRQKFEGVFPPPRKDRNRPAANPPAQPPPEPVQRPALPPPPQQ